ncbi:hypothetical protein ACA910_001705 [Epithemia clementina (nom. ined.)]
MGFIIRLWRRARLLVLLGVLVNAEYSHVNEEKRQDDELDEDLLTEHDRFEEDLYIDVTKRLGNNTDLGFYSVEEASTLVTHALLEGSGIHAKLESLFEKAKSTECRQLVAEHLGYFMAALGREEKMPFARWGLESTCPLSTDEATFGTKRRKDAWWRESEYITDQADLRILYAILTHDDPASTIRLVESLYEPGHEFVIHVDGKETSDATYHILSDYASSLDYVHVLPHPYRVRVNWGGFSMVNATLQILRYSFGLLTDINERELDFHKVIHLSGTTYPIASNAEIRREIAEFPLDANLMNIIEVSLQRASWSYFVECDDAVHRIHDLVLPAEFELYTSSQWWIASRAFAYYLAAAEPGTFVYEFIDYASHVVVSDETFFGTILKNTEFCVTLYNRNFNFLKFGRWENDVSTENRDKRKCPMKDPDYCGRSPVTMKVEDAALLELSDDLFARKFDPKVDSKIKDLVDVWRADSEKRLTTIVGETGSDFQSRGRKIEFAGHGTLIVAKDTVDDSVPLCLGASGDYVFLTACFHQWVLQKLSDAWETGTVVLEDTRAQNQWEFNPCSTTDGDVKYNGATGSMHVVRSNYSMTGPRCALISMGKPGHCIDGYRKGPNGKPVKEARLSKCSRPWNQLVSFGDGSSAPAGSLFFTTPHYLHDTNEIDESMQHKFVCLGVREDKVKPMASVQDGNSSNHSESFMAANQERAPLSKWMDRKIFLTPCTNEGAVIEWIYVPYSKERQTIQGQSKTAVPAGQVLDGQLARMCDKENS